MCVCNAFLGVGKSLYGVNVCMCVCYAFLGVGKSLYGVNVCVFVMLSWASVVAVWCKCMYVCL